MARFCTPPPAWPCAAQLHAARCAPPYDASPRTAAPAPRLPALQRCEERFAKSKLVHSIMRHVAETSGANLEELYAQIAWPLYRKYGHAYDAFRTMINVRRRGLAWGAAWGSAGVCANPRRSVWGSAGAATRWGGACAVLPSHGALGSASWHWVGRQGRTSRGRTGGGPGEGSPQAAGWWRDAAQPCPPSAAPVGWAPAPGATATAVPRPAPCAQALRTQLAAAGRAAPQAAEAEAVFKRLSEEEFGGQPIPALTEEVKDGILKNIK